MNTENINWAENVVLVDGDYLDKVAFDLTVNFERMLERRIPQADLPHWIDCIALDGGLREGDNNVQVMFIHQKGSLKNFNPSGYEEINRKAFKDTIAEFEMSAYPVENIVSKDDFFIQVLGLLKNEKEIKRLMIVPDIANINNVKHELRDADEKNITVFAMQPITGGNFRQEILGYSLMSALGITASEIEKKQADRLGD